uniref:Receptor-like protein 12 n=1 Tax=Noccaea caerulescens TaxID=107243 RepID=A0A1J3JKW0_NOCCA
MSTIHITLSFMFLFIFNFQDLFAISTRHLCRREQRDALLELKNEFEIGNQSLGCANENLKTESWAKNSDCCYWDGIKCDANSGEVIGLNLSSSCLRGRFHSYTSLFKLQHIRSLTTLDLSNNDLYGQIPSSIENLSHLTFLDLSSNHFTGKIPSSVGNLSHLTSLIFSANQFTGQIPSSIGKLSHLTSLSLTENQFFGRIPSSLGNLSRLAFLDLSSNSFDGEIPSSFGSLNQLTGLAIESNKLSGNISITLVNLTKLSFLSLSNNQFTGTLPPNINSLPKLEFFYVEGNNFVGTFPSSLFSIPSLAYIDLSYNQFNGTLEFGNISSPSKLQDLRLGNNNFRGPIPRSISKLVNLKTLELSHWNTQGPVDLSIFSHLKSLKEIDLSYLNTTTTIDLNAILSYFKSLQTLALSGNRVLTTSNNSSVSDLPWQSLASLFLSGCGITEIPELVRILEQLQTLDVSNNKINGQVARWLWTLPNLGSVDLSNNSFVSFEKLTEHGLSFVLWHLVASKNNFTGLIPSFICELRSLSILDLSKNNFSGSIPPCTGNLKSSLSVLNLRQNRLGGGLPENVFESLRSFDVGHNQLVGKLPRSLIHFSNLEVLNAESNKINDTFPSWLSSLQKLQVLVLRSNAFHGPIHEASFLKLKIMDISHNHFTGTLPSDYFLNWSALPSSLGANKDPYMGDGYYQDSIVLMNKGVELEYQRILKIYTAIDFSGNGFQGEIPRSIGLLKELHVLNLSNNAFTGHIPSSMGNLTALESLDVSQNKLSGEIPQELGKLSFLAYMNFSHNQLVGLVPGGTQFGRQPCSSFQYNSGLFGSSLDDDCPSSQQYETPDSEEEDEDEDEEVFSWIAATIGFGPGIVFGLTIGYVLVIYKPEWFTNLFRRNKHRSRSTTTR